MNAQDLAKALLEAPADAVTEKLEAAFKEMSDAEVAALMWDWGFWARKEQLPPPGDWDVWLILSGRGWGKTRTGSETVLRWARDNPGCRIALVGATAADVRDVMIEGDSGLLSVCPPWFQGKYEPSKRRVTFPNGSRATCFSAEEEQRLRGPQFHFAWCDELAAWPEPEAEGADSAWKMLRFCVRLGKAPKIIVTTTPKPTETIVELATKTPKVVITEGHTFDNAANLAGPYLNTMRSLFGGTRLGEQELAGKLLLDTPGALFKASLFYETAVQQCPPFSKVVIALDPANSSNEGADLTGIVAVAHGIDDHVYVLRDRTLKASPDGWAREAIKAFHAHGASYIVAETNVGGDMVESTIRSVDPNIPVRTVRAMRGKAKRAEPVAAVLEQRRLHLVGDPHGPEWKTFLQQAQRFTGVNGKRDDRVDAMVWGVHDLLFADSPFFLV